MSGFTWQVSRCVMASGTVLLALSCTSKVDSADGASMIEFAGSSSAVMEVDKTHHIVVTRSDASIPASVSYAVANSQARNHDRCTPKDYHLMAGTLAFAPGERSKSIAMTIHDDTLFEADEQIELLLSDPSGGRLGERSRHTLTISDDDRPKLVSVKDYGAQGDGTTDDTRAIQQAVDDVHDQGGGVIIFPPGDYLIAGGPTEGVILKPNITYVGYGARTLRPANQGFWNRTFSTSRRAPLVGAAEPLVIQGFVMDGNSQNQGPYQGFELQQQHLLFLTGNPEMPHRLHAFVEDVRLQWGVADAIHVWHNVDAKLCHIRADNVFRGGLVVAGGFTKVYAYDMITAGHVDPTGIDIEVDAAGYGGDWNTEITLERLHLLDGDFDYSMWNAGDVSRSTLIINDLISRGSAFFLYPREAKVRVTDAEIWIGLPASGGMNQFFQPADVIIDHADFYVTKALRYHGDERTEEDPEVMTALDIMWQNEFSTTIIPGQLFICNNCAFHVDPATVEPADTVYVAQAWGIGAAGQILLNGGSVDPAFDGVFSSDCEVCRYRPVLGEDRAPGRRAVVWPEDAAFRARRLRGHGAAGLRRAA